MLLSGQRPVHLLLCLCGLWRPTDEPIRSPRLLGQVGPNDGTTWRLLKEWVSIDLDEPSFAAVRWLGAKTVSLMSEMEPARDPPAHACRRCGLAVRCSRECCASPAIRSIGFLRGRSPFCIIPAQGWTNWGQGASDSWTTAVSMDLGPSAWRMHCKRRLERWKKRNLIQGFIKETVPGIPTRSCARGHCQCGSPP